MRPVFEDERFNGDPCDSMVSVVRGRNDLDLPTPSAPSEEQERLFIMGRKSAMMNEWPYEYLASHRVNPSPTPSIEAFCRSKGVVQPGRMWSHLADFVGMDDPLDWHSWLRKNSGEVTLVEPQDERSPKQCGVDFLGLVGLDRRVSMAVEDALIEAFQAKYYFKQPRPSHHFRAGTLVESAPCPAHWSYPAGHGAIFGAIAEVWATHTISRWSADDLRDSAHQLAHARTGRGVHWPEDNKAGVAVGVARANT